MVRIGETLAALSAPMLFVDTGGLQLIKSFSKISCSVAQMYFDISTSSDFFTNWTSILSLSFWIVEVPHTWKIPADDFLSRVKTEELRKEYILAGLRDIWRVFLEILPLHKSNEQTNKNLRNKLITIICSYFFLVFLCFEPRSPNCHHCSSPWCQVEMQKLFRNEYFWLWVEIRLGDGLYVEPVTTY